MASYKYVNSDIRKNIQAKVTIFNMSLFNEDALTIIVFTDNQRSSINLWNSIFSERVEVIYSTERPLIPRPVGYKSSQYKKYVKEVNHFIEHYLDKKKVIWGVFDLGTKEEPLLNLILASRGLRSVEFASLTEQSGVARDVDQRAKDVAGGGVAGSAASGETHEVDILSPVSCSSKLCFLGGKLPCRGAGKNVDPNNVKHTKLLTKLREKVIPRLRVLDEDEFQEVPSSLPPISRLTLTSETNLEPLSRPKLEPTPRERFLQASTTTGASTQTWSSETLEYSQSSPSSKSVSRPHLQLFRSEDTGRDTAFPFTESKDSPLSVPSDDDLPVFDDVPGPIQLGAEDESRPPKPFAYEPKPPQTDVENESEPIQPDVEDESEPPQPEVEDEPEPTQPDVEDEPDPTKPDVEDKQEGKSSLPKEKETLI